MVVRKWWSGLFLSEVNIVRHTKMSLFWIPRQVIKGPYQVEKDHNWGVFWTCGNKILRSKSTNYYEHKKYKTLLLLRSSITTAHDNFYTFSHTITGIDFPRNGTRDSSTFIWFENGQVTRENKVTMKKEKAGKLAKLTSSKSKEGNSPGPVINNHNCVLWKALQMVLFWFLHRSLLDYIGNPFFTPDHNVCVIITESLE